MWKREDLEKKARDELLLIPGAEWIKNRYRSLEIVILNRTSHTLDYGNRSYFHSGCFSHPPQQDKIKPGHISVITVSNVEGSVLCGVTGALQYRISGTNQYLHIGFCNPATGSYKYYIGITTDQPPNFGYDECVDVDTEQPLVAWNQLFRMVARTAPPVHAQNLMVFELEHNK